ncbi:hypothetical protein BDN71DRAFT_1438344 [Pleurotus eryngii]|uniref:Uncharacterized protein n=1 Tax=Pleurotus eryngii TaxID=5323 RepID=A0A9P6A7P4_PLEER|nr:hypothetical protein BDN71DRAFT_1438344 [Pleurotus eryngii]
MTGLVGIFFQWAHTTELIFAFGRRLAFSGYIISIHARQQQEPPPMSSSWASLGRKASVPANSSIAYCPSPIPPPSWSRAQLLLGFSSNL